MSIREDVFGLEQVYRLQVEGQWSVKPDVWLSPSPYYASWDFGYFGGGAVGSPRAMVSRIDYSNDTATALGRGPLSGIRSQFSATGNGQYGYFGWWWSSWYLFNSRSH